MNVHVKRANTGLGSMFCGIRSATERIISKYGRRSGDSQET